MAIKNSELEYGSRARALHWLVAICNHFVVKSDAHDDWCEVAND